MAPTDALRPRVSSLRRSARALLLAHLLVLPMTLRPVLAVEDCNGNGQTDEEDIATGASADCNGDGLPDDCEAVAPPPGSRGDLPLPGPPVDLVVAELRGREGSDVAVIAVLEAGFRVTVFTPSPDGGWETWWERDSGVELSRIAAGDLDGDGDRDLVLVDPDGIVAWLNDGEGEFGEPLRLASRRGVRELELADLNLDGSLDVVATDPGSDAFIVLLSDGAGHSERVHELPQDPAANPMRPGPTVADWDRDGDPDLAVPDGTGGLAFFSNEGDGTLARADGPDLGPLLGALAADLDRDGLDDVLTIHRSEVSLLRNRGGPDFEPLAAFQSNLRGQSVLAVGIADLDLDEDPDLALVLGGRGVPEDLQLLENDGEGILVAAPPLRLDFRPDHLETGDLDGDGESEVLLWSENRERVQVFFDDDALPPSAPLPLQGETVALGDIFEPHSTVLADLDGDGDLDLATMDGEDRVRILTNDGRGAFEEGETYSLDGASEIVSIAGADLDDDGDTDIAAVDELTENLLILRNRGDASFRQLDEQYGIGNRATFVIAADIDGDGRQDLVCTNSADGDLSLFLNRGEAIFDPEIEIFVGHTPTGVAAADLDGDGDLDLAVSAGGVVGGVSVLFNRGEASFDEPADYDIGTSVYITAADLDGDGDVDLVAAQETAERVVVLLNGGDGAFDASTRLEIGQSPRSVIALDLDGDDRPELVTGNARNDTVTVLASRGAGRFSAAVRHEVGGAPRFVVGGDLDGDGDADLIAANHDSHTFTVLFNDPAAAAWLPAICTERDFHEVSRPLPRGEIRERLTHYLLPVDPGAPDTLPALFTEVPIREFLPAVYPHRFFDGTDEDYQRLVGRRASREYFTGRVLQLHAGREVFHGFDVLSDSVPDATELPSIDELREVQRALSTVFSFANLLYFPHTPASLRDASSWTDPDFAILLPTEFFRRGDASHDGIIDITDPIFLLEHLFLDATAPHCEKAADANDDGAVDLGDSVTILLHLFRGTIPIPEPFSSCARDPTPDSLSCREIAPCASFEEASGGA